MVRELLIGNYEKVVTMVGTKDQETQYKEQQVMTLLQDNHGRIFLVVLVQVLNHVVQVQVELVHQDVFLVLVDKDNGVMVLLLVLVVVLQVYT